MFLPAKRTASASGLSRLPPQSAQGRSTPSYHSFHQISSPVCSASNPSIAKPVP